MSEQKPREPLAELAQLRKENERLRAETDTLSSALSSLVKVVDANVPRHLPTFQQTINAAREALAQNAIHRWGKALSNRK